MYVWHGGNVEGENCAEFIEWWGVGSFHIYIYIIYIYIWIPPFSFSYSLTYPGLYFIINFPVRYRENWNYTYMGRWYYIWKKREYRVHTTLLAKPVYLAENKNLHDLKLLCEKKEKYNWKFDTLPNVWRNHEKNHIEFVEIFFIGKLLYDATAPNIPFLCSSLFYIASSAEPPSWSASDIHWCSSSIPLWQNATIFDRGGFVSHPKTNPQPPNHLETPILQRPYVWADILATHISSSPYKHANIH